MPDGGQVPARKAESSLAPPVDEAIGFQVIERVAVGRSLEQIAEVPGMPSKETFLVWMALSPALASAYKQAQEISAYGLEDEALAILRRLRDEAPTPARIRATQMLVEHIRWTAEKRNPRVYAKQAAGVATVPIQINTNLDLGDNGGTGTKEFPNIYALQAKHETVEELEPYEEGSGKRITRRERIEKMDAIEKQAERRKRRREVVKAYRARKRQLTPKGEPSGGSPTT